MDRSQRVRQQWKAFKKWLEAPEKAKRSREREMLNEIRRTTSSASTSRTRKEDQEAISRSLQEELVAVAREEWQKRLAAAGLRDEDWIDMTERELKDVSEKLGGLDDDSILEDVAEPSSSQKTGAAVPQRASDVEGYGFVDPTAFGLYDDSFSFESVFPGIGTEEDDTIEIPDYALWGREWGRETHHSSHSSQTSSQESSQTSSPERSPPQYATPEFSMPRSSRVPSVPLAPERPPDTSNPQQYIGPHLLDPEEQKIEDEKFFEFAFEVRVAKINEFHQLAAAADAQLAHEIYIGIRTRTMGKEEQKRRLAAHQRFMVDLRSSKDNERKAIIKQERDKRLSEFNSRKRFTRERDSVVEPPSSQTDQIHAPNSKQRAPAPAPRPQPAEARASGPPSSTEPPPQRLHSRQQSQHSLVSDGQPRPVVMSHALSESSTKTKSDVHPFEIWVPPNAPQAGEQRKSKANSEAPKKPVMEEKLPFEVSDVLRQDQQVIWNEIQSTHKQSKSKSQEHANDQHISTSLKPVTASASTSTSSLASSTPMLTPGSVASTLSSEKSNAHPFDKVERRAPAPKAALEVPSLGPEDSHESTSSSSSHVHPEIWRPAAVRKSSQNSNGKVERAAAAPAPVASSSKVTLDAPLSKKSRNSNSASSLQDTSVSVPSSSKISLDASKNVPVSQATSKAAPPPPPPMASISKTASEPQPSTSTSAYRKPGEASAVSAHSASAQWTPPANWSINIDQSRASAARLGNHEIWIPPQQLQPRSRKISDSSISSRYSTARGGDSHYAWDLDGYQQQPAQNVEIKRVRRMSDPPSPSPRSFAFAELNNDNEGIATSTANIKTANTSAEVEKRPSSLASKKSGKAKAKSRKTVTIEEIPDDESDWGPSSRRRHDHPSDPNAIMEPKPSVAPAMFSPIFKYDGDDGSANVKVSPGARKRETGATPSVAATSSLGAASSVSSSINEWDFGDLADDWKHNAGGSSGVPPVTSTSHARWMPTVEPALARPSGDSRKQAVDRKRKEKVDVAIPPEDFGNTADDDLRWFELNAAAVLKQMESQ